MCRDFYEIHESRREITIVKSPTSEHYREEREVVKRWIHWVVQSSYVGFKSIWFLCLYSW